MFQQINNKNSSDVTGLETFLNTYISDQVKFENSSVKLDTINEKNSDCSNFSNIFAPLQIRLDDKENSSDNAFSMIDVSIPVMTSYKECAELINLKFSVLDMLSTLNNLQVQKIKQIFKDYYPLLLINTYKFKMMIEFYEIMNIEVDFKSVIYKIIILTLKSVVEDIESCRSSSFTNNELQTVLFNLQSPPSLDFCKQWIELHELACIIQNMNDDECILYNYEYYKPNVYIHFEFYNKTLTLLKSAKIDVENAE
ncbi:KM727_gp31-like protein [Aratus pisonii nudivirus]|nr:KM727_gp31-like protein [Aratus pisonii nudivirus]